MPTTHADVVAVFSEIADLLEIEGANPPAVGMAMNFDLNLASHD
jgi:hypothetical protein